jgi:hypothetical protein
VRNPGILSKGGYYKIRTFREIANHLLHIIFWEKYYSRLVNSSDKVSLILISSPKMKRANFYIDGFNLYYGLVTAGYSDCKWLDVVHLANRIKNSDHQLISTKYFTSRVTNNPGKQKRQSTYLDALNTTRIELIYGQFLAEQVNCRFCKTSSWEIKEKMTDVNIATNGHETLDLQTKSIQSTPPPHSQTAAYSDSCTVLHLSPSTPDGCRFQLSGLCPAHRSYRHYEL